LSADFSLFHTAETHIRKLTVQFLFPPVKALRGSRQQFCPIHYLPAAAHKGIPTICKYILTGQQHFLKNVFFSHSYTPPFSISGSQYKLPLFSLMLK
jgi:hypothetical protein